MITLSTFQEYLSSKEILSSKKSLSEPPLPLSNRSVDGQEHYLLKLLAILPSQTPAQQAEQLEKILIVLRSTNIDEQQRLKLTATVIDATDQLIATLRQHYIYEIGALSDGQMAYAAQVKSLYYLIIMVYDRVICHKQSLPISQRKYPTSKVWQRYFKTNSASSITLATAIYQTLLMYQKLMVEDAICYQKPSPYLWAKINQLYSLAYQHHVVNTNLSMINLTKVTQYANTVHQLYCQICLHSLLNVRAMPRPNILLVQRLLPEWARHIVATIEPRTETRVFVDLQSDNPPTYLTANSDINPYEDHCQCLFIELTPVVDHLETRRQALLEEGSEGVEYCLLNKIAMMIAYRYLQPKPSLATKFPIKKEAVLMTGFNTIHYHVSGSKNFANLIAMKDLPEEQRPYYDTDGQKQNSRRLLISETLGSNNEASLFRTFQLATDAGSLLTINNDDTQTLSNRTETIANDATIVDNEKVNLKAMTANDENDELVSTAPPPLAVMSLVLVCRSDASAPADWSMGVVRWLNFDNKETEVDWQVLGHTLVACGLRLEGRETRNKHFVPAFILGKNEQLKTTGTLIVPTAYFQKNDRVIMRINNNQTLLRLGSRLLVTDEFSQYEVAKL